MAAAAVHCIGSINLDFQVRVNRWPDGAETLEATSYLRAPGGKGANRAFLARKLGAPAVLIGRVGDDEFGQEALQPLRKLYVDVTQVVVTPEQATGVAMIAVRPDGAKTILLASNANARADAEDAARIAQAIGKAPSGSVVTIDLEVPRAVVEAALDAANSRRMPVLLDPSPAGRMLDSYYDRVDWITPNHTEAMTLSGIEIRNQVQAKEAARKLAAAGARGVCVKLSEGGCFAVVNKEEYSIDAPRVAVVDKTGAGDAFAGALATAVFEQQSTRDALQFAVCASTLATTGYGSQAAYPNRETLERAVRELQA